jgi:hypothetical protein
LRRRSAALAAAHGAAAERRKCGDLTDATEALPDEAWPMIRELAHRSADAVEVSLFWHEIDDTVALRVHYPSLDEHVELEVPRDRALDAFQRPDAYLAAAKASAPAPRRWFSLMGRRASHVR